jgi:hypothetical protein
VAFLEPDPDEVCEELQMRSTVFIGKMSYPRNAIRSISLVWFDEIGVLDRRHKFLHLADFFGRVRPCNHFFPIVVGKSEG